MVQTKKLNVFILLLTFQQIAVAQTFIKKSDLKGRWDFKKMACSTGKVLDEVKNGTFSYDGKRLSLRFKDEKSKKEISVLDTEYFVVQEDLLTARSKDIAETPTFKVEKKSENTLVLRFPIVGLAGDCPENDLKVLTFERIK